MCPDPTAAPPGPSRAWLDAVLADVGLPAAAARPLAGAGTVNHVFVVGTGADRWVIRSPRDRRSVDVFAAEQWSAAQARTIGIPTPEMLAVGTREGRPFSVQRFVPGTRAADLPHRHDELASTLGDYCLRIGQIPPATNAPAALFSRFGADLAAAWTAHLDYNARQLDGADPLLRLGVLSSAEQRMVADRIAWLRDQPQRFGLTHGDLAPRNVLLPDPGTGAGVLIDWGSASFGPVPWRDLLNLERDRRREALTSWRYLRRFAEAAGVDLVGEWEVLAAHRLLHHVDLVRWALDRRPDRVPDTVAELREILDSRSTPAAG